MSLKIIKITDDKVGDIAITDGIIYAIDKNYDVKIINFEIKFRNKILLQMLKQLIKYKWFEHLVSKNINILRLFYKDFYIPKQDIDFIVSTGSDTLFLNIQLAKYFNAKNIYYSHSAKLKSEYFYLIISRTKLEFKNSVFIETAPVKINTHNAEKLVESFCQKHNNLNKMEKYFVLMVGGNGSGYSFARQDFTNVINGFMKQVIKYQAKALITTSRRTGPKNEKYLMELLKDYKDNIVYTSYYNQNPEKVVEIYLELGSVIFVTEESESMITESLYFKKPVFTLYAHKIKENDKYEKYEEFLNVLSCAHRIVRLPIDSDLLSIDLYKFVFNYIEQPPIEYLAGKIRSFIEDTSK